MLSRPPASLAAAISSSAARSRRVSTVEDLRDLLLADHRGQAVGAQQHDIAGAHRIGPGVDLDVALDAQRAGDDRALRMLGGLLLGELALADELLDQRVVLGQARELAVAEDVGAAVADVGHRQVIVLEVGGGERGTHPGVLVLGPREVVDPPVGGADAVGQPLLGAALVRQRLVELLHGQLGGHLPGLRAAHPVGDDEQRRPHERVVLVVPALAPGVGLPDRVGCAEHARGFLVVAHVEYGRSLDMRRRTRRERPQASAAVPHSRRSGSARPGAWGCDDGRCGHCR